MKTMIKFWVKSSAPGLFLYKELLYDIFNYIGTNRQ